MNMPSFRVSFDDDGLQSSTELAAVKCATNAGDVAAAVLCKRQPAYYESQGASAKYAEKVDDNFQNSESPESLVMRKERVISRRMLMRKGVVVRTKGGSCEDAMPINGFQQSEGRQSSTSSIGLAHQQHDIQCADDEDEEEACLTPRAEEHRIPSQIFICPPPPRKKRRSTPLSWPDCGIKVVRKRLSYAKLPSSTSSSAISGSSARYASLQRQYAASCPVVGNPPDLNTFPACIRALFFHD